MDGTIFNAYRKTVFVSPARVNQLRQFHSYLLVHYCTVHQSTISSSWSDARYREKQALLSGSDSATMIAGCWSRCTLLRKFSEARLLIQWDGWPLFPGVAPSLVTEAQPRWRSCFPKRMAISPEPRIMTSLQ